MSAVHLSWNIPVIHETNSSDFFASLHSSVKSQVDPPRQAPVIPPHADV